MKNEDFVKLLLQMVEKSKTEKKLFLALKGLAVKCQQFELGAELRDMEKKLFPLTKEQTEAHEFASQLDVAFRMAEVKADKGLCWLTGQIVKEYQSKGGKFSIDDATTLVETRKKLFEDE